jgi:hypothetical protein
MWNVSPGKLSTCFFANAACLAKTDKRIVKDLNLFNYSTTFDFQKNHSSLFPIQISKNSPHHHRKMIRWEMSVKDKH